MPKQQETGRRPLATSWSRSRISALGLMCLLSCSACSTESPTQQPRKPQWTTAECPPPKVQLDRSFAVAFPDCADRLLDPTPLKGKWLGVAIDQAERSGLQKTCLKQLIDWRDAEIDARKKGSPGS